MTTNRTSTLPSPRGSDRGRATALRRGIAAICAAVFLTAGQPAFPQENAPIASPVLTVDQERLFDQSAFGRAAVRALEAESAALAAENRRIEAELTEEERRLTAERATDDPAVFREKAAAFDAKVVEIRREQDQKARDLSRRPEELRQQFFRAAIPVLAQLIRERGAVAILDSRAILLSADVIDITDEAIVLIDQALPTYPADQDAAPDSDGETVP